MTVHFSTLPRKGKPQRKARQAALRFLRENHATLTSLLELLGRPDLAARIASLFDLASRGRVNLSAINGAFAEALRCLAEAPSHLEGPHDQEWSDLDAALRWMGARLADFDALMRSLHASRS